MSGCVSCGAGASAVRNLTDEHGHWARECDECGHEWGPFVSPRVLEERGEAHLYPETCGVGGEEGQRRLGDF